MFYNVIKVWDMEHRLYQEANLKNGLQLAISEY